MAQQVFIQIRFQEDVPVNGQKITYSDALYYTQDDYAKLTPEDIEKVKLDRITNWVNIITTPQPVIEPTEEDLIAQQASIDEQIANLQSQKLDLSMQVQAIEASKIQPVPVEQVKEIG